MRNLRLRKAIAPTVFPPIADALSVMAAYDLLSKEPLNIGDLGKLAMTVYQSVLYPAVGISCVEPIVMWVLLSQIRFFTFFAFRRILSRN